MNIGFFYQIWYTNQTAAFDAFKQLRKIYPNNELHVMFFGLKQEKIESYHKNYTEIIEKEFNITKVDYASVNDYKPVFEVDTNIDDTIKYSHAILDRTVFMPSDNVDIIVNGSEDWYVFKSLPITGEFEMSGRITGWDPWMNPEVMKKKFDYSVNSNPIWFQHGHYINIKLFKEKYTEENKKYITESLKEAYPNYKVFPDYILGVWGLLAFTKFQSGNEYIYELPSEVNNETPFESFQKTDCYCRHGYKSLYGTPLTEEMLQLGIKNDKDIILGYRV